jgi:hypothetical protein
VDNCSDPYILASAVSLFSYRNIRSLQAGETCNYRLKSTCGAPIFQASAGGSWSSSLKDFNITWNEFEQKTVEMERTVLATEDISG